MAKKPGHQMECKCEKCGYKWVSFDPIEPVPSRIVCPKCGEIFKGSNTYKLR